MKSLVIARARTEFSILFKNEPTRPRVQKRAASHNQSDIFNVRLLRRRIIIVLQYPKKLHLLLNKKLKYVYTVITNWFSEIF